MKPEDITRARETLGRMWGLGRPLKQVELGRALRIRQRDPGRRIADYEGETTIPGPVEVCIEMWLAGSKPPDELSAIIIHQGRPAKVTTP